MAIKVNLEKLLAEHHIGLTELADKTGMNLVGLANLQSNEAEAIRFSTLDTLCRELKCSPGDILQYSDK